LGVRTARADGLADNSNVSPHYAFMKRDMDIIRQILLNVEDDKYQLGERIRLPGVPDDICAKHVALILDAGLAIGRTHKSDSYGIVAADIERLTSAGHDFCDGIRQDTIWNLAKEHIIKPGASYGLAVLVEWVRVEVRRRVFGIPPNS
jgi:hypothetical protein